MRKMSCHQTLYGLPKHFPKKINKSSCKICYAANKNTFTKWTTVDTINLQPVELIHMEFALYHVISICRFTSMLTIVCKKNIMLCVFPTASKQAHVCIISFILTTLKNEQQPCKCIRVDEDGALSKSTDVTKLLVE